MERAAGRMVTDAVILAAGASSRMGTPKALLPWDGETLVGRHVRVFADAGLRVHVVLGAFASEIARALPERCARVVNPNWSASGPSDSAWCALEHLGACIVTPVDTVPGSPAVLAALLGAGASAVPTFAGQPGHPVRLDPPHRSLRLDLRLADALRVPVDDPDILMNFNTPEQWQRWRARKKPTTLLR